MTLPVLGCKQVFLLLSKGIPFSKHHTHAVQGILQDLLYMICCKFLKHYDSTAAEQCIIKLEWWVLSSRSYQGYCSILNMREECVLVQRKRCVCYYHSLVDINILQQFGNGSFIDLNVQVLLFNVQFVSLIMSLTQSLYPPLNQDLKNTS